MNYIQKVLCLSVSECMYTHSISNGEFHDGAHNDQSIAHNDAHKPHIEERKKVLQLQFPVKLDNKETSNFLQKSKQMQLIKATVLT